MSDERPWKELTPAEKSARMAAGKARKAAERAAAAPAGIIEFADVPAPATDLFAPVELSDDEVMNIRAWALEQARKEQRQRKIDAMKAAALHQAREEMGLIVKTPEDAQQERLAEIVSVTIDIPEGGSRDGDFIWLDGKPFANGMTYPVTRAVYETIRDICNKQWVQWAMFKGERSNHYNKMRGRFENAYGGGYASGTGGRALATPHQGLPAAVEKRLAI